MIEILQVKTLYKATCEDCNYQFSEYFHSEADFKESLKLLGWDLLFYPELMCSTCRKSNED